MKLLPPATEGWRRYCFHMCVCVSTSGWGVPLLSGPMSFLGVLGTFSAPCLTSFLGDPPIPPGGTLVTGWKGIPQSEPLDTQGEPLPPPRECLRCGQYASCRFPQEDFVCNELSYNEFGYKVFGRRVRSSIYLLHLL